MSSTRQGPSVRWIPAIRQSRYCWRCRREWSADTQSCPECLLWLGDALREQRFFWLGVDAPPLDRSDPEAHQPAWRTGLVLSVTIAVSREPVAREAHCALDTYLAGLSDAIAGYGGLLVRTPEPDVGLTAIFTDRLGGDGLLHRALAAALWVRDRGRPPDILTQLGLAVRIVLNAGPLCLWRRGAAHAVRGGVVARAQTLAREVPPGVAVATEAVFRRAAATHDLFAIGLSGISTSDLPLYALVGPKQPMSHCMSETHRGALIGRARELAALRSALLELRNGRGSQLCLVGEPGLGKTKLLATWLQASAQEGLLDGVAVCEGMGVAYGDSPGWVLRSVLRGWAGDGDPQRIWECLQRLALPSGSRDLLAALAETSTAAPSALSGAIRDFLSRIRGPRGLILILDDLHWADDLSLEVLRRLAEGARADEPSVLVFSYRPSGAERLGSLPDHADVMLHLEPLDTDESASLVRARLPAGQLPADLAAKLAGLAGGNPLYVEEAIGLLQDAGALHERAGHWELAQPVQEIRLPESTANVILARIEHLADSQVAAIRRRQQSSWVSQSPYERDALLASIEAVEARIGAWLDRLETIDVADQLAVGRYLQRLERIDFDLLLERMLLGRPRPRNARLAAAIDRLESGSLETSRALLADRLALGDRTAAVEEAIRRAERALRRGDQKTAVEFYRLAWTSTGDASPPNHPSLLRDLAAAEAAMGDLDAVREHYLIALREASPGQRAAVLLCLAEVALRQPDVPGAREWLACARAAGAAANPHKSDRYAVVTIELAQAEGNAGRARYWAGRLRWEHLEPWLGVRAALALAAHAHAAGRITAARRWLWRAIDLVPDDEHPNIGRRLNALIDQIELIPVT